MRTLVVFNHPYDGSYCNAILQAVQKGLSDSNQPYDIIHLDHDGFDPVMSGSDLLAFAKARTQGVAALENLHPQVLDYARRLQDAEHLVLIFPIWWELMPARMKGFIDKLIFPGIAYEYTANGMMRSTLKNLKRVTVISTMNTPGIIYKTIFGNAIRGSLMMGTFRKLGIKNAKWINLSRVKGVSREKREKWLADLQKRFVKL